MSSIAIHRRIPASSSAVPRLRGIARSYAAGSCGLDDDQATLVAMVVTEAAANVVLHAYPDQPGMIEFAADADEGELRVCVSDRGVGIDSPSANRGLGAGLRIMRGLARTQISSQPGRGTRVELRFRLPGSGSTPPPASAAPPPPRRR
jgi:anti-sigma regulatory factor (Ser/Thr protein kinase)